MAIAAENIDEAKAEEARQRAEARLREKLADEEVATVNAALARSLAQLRVKRRPPGMTAYRYSEERLSEGGVDLTAGGRSSSRPEGQREPEVALDARVFHGDNYFADATAAEEKKVYDATRRLTEMGFQERHQRVP